MLLPVAEMHSLIVRAISHPMPELGAKTGDSFQIVAFLFTGKAGDETRGIVHVN